MKNLQSEEKKREIGTIKGLKWGKKNYGNKSGAIIIARFSEEIRSGI